MYEFWALKDKKKISFFSAKIQIFKVHIFGSFLSQNMDFLHEKPTKNHFRVT